MEHNEHARPGKNSRHGGAASREAAAEIRAARARARLTQREAAAASEVPYGTYRKMETGEHAIDLDQLARVARGLGMSAPSVVEMAFAAWLRENERKGDS